jgi:ribonucleoside-diphosphate reductase alpha chain
MPVSHPDILDFIKCKKTDGSLSNMNISVSITDEFMERLNTNTPFELKSVYDDKRIYEIDPNIIWDNIVDMSWKTADPGILFLDNINKYNVLKKTLKIKSTNPCGELPLIPWGACNLSAINLSKFVMGNWIEDKATFDWDELYSTAYNIMGLMDNIIDNSEFPDERFKDISTKYRNVGIGFMGLADVMYMLNIKYDSGEGRRFAKEIMKTIQTACVEKSAELAEQKGTFHNYSFHKDDVEEIVSKLIENNEEVMEKVRSYGLRNIAHSCIAPTGTVAISADCSYGMEPTFGLVFKKNLIDGGTMHFVNSIFEKKFENEEWYNEKLLDKISKNGGSLKGIHGIPEKVRRVFVVAHDIKSKDRIDMQAALSKHVSSAISSTVNLPKETTKEEISNLYKYAYESGLKGITIYRDGCKRNQPITFKEEKRDENFDRPMTLIGETHRINTANGHLYITVNRMPNGEIIEIMPQLGKGGNKMNSMTEAVGRLLSTGLQKPLTIKEIVKQLKGINDESTWCKLDENDTKPVQILSIPDAIAKLLEKKYLTNGSDSGTFGIESDEICPKCGSNLLLMEGCLNCTCGYSKCS